MTFSLNTTLLILSVLLTGLSAGLCFTWTNAVTTGIGHLDDFGYLSAFQQMNRSILNLPFFIVFFGPVFTNFINLYLNKAASSQLLWLLAIATILYVFGVALVTIFGNVPLNELLDNTDLTSASIEELKGLRIRFENKWNRLHLIRTISAAVSFLLLVVAVLIKK